jgi:hypothetical protein
MVMAKGTKWYGRSGISDFNPGKLPGGAKPYKGNGGPKITDEMREAIVRRMNKGKKKGGIRNTLPVGGMTPIGGNSNNGPRPFIPGGPRNEFQRRGTKWYGKRAR